jgi:hypothetical protein
MNDASPHSGGLGGDSRQGRSERTTSDGLQDVRADEERDLRWSTRRRCLAVLRELEAPLPDYESMVVLLQGAAEDIEAASPADKRGQ